MRISVLGMALTVALGINCFAQTITLDGQHATTADIMKIADGATVAVSPAARQRVQQSFDVLLNAAKTGQKIYGLTVGVGWNKDRNFLTIDSQLSPALIKASIAFNKGLIHAHVGAVGTPLEPRMVRAIMAVRLNEVLTGASGLQPAFVDTYLDMLNKNVIPVIPSKGSIGEADITVLGHIALNMIGEGEVFYRGQRMPAAQAFAQAGITIHQPYGKDALAILSNNAYALAVASADVEKLRQLVEIQPLVYALSLEALDGNVAPILADNVSAKGFPYGVDTARTLRQILAGSYLWQPSETRAVQDPLSFRDAVWIMSTLTEMLTRIERKVNIQLNHADDNPTVVVGGDTQANLPEISRRYLQDGSGALFPSANFDPSPWVIDIEATTIALAHNANASVQRFIRLNNPKFTHLTRFLGTDKTYHAFGAMEKPPVALVREIQMLANPASVASIPVAGMIEDVATNAPLAVNRLAVAIDDYAYILGMELLHSAQAIDLRLQANPKLTLGHQTNRLYQAFRQYVHFLDVDKPLSHDFELARQFVLTYYSAQH